MAVNDVSYNWVQSGSTTAANDLAHYLYGSWSGLSLFSASEVFHIQMMASGANLALFPTDRASIVQAGQYFKEDINAYLDLPPLKRTQASELHFANLTAGDNAVARWVIWQRVAY